MHDSAGLLERAAHDLRSPLGVIATTCHRVVTTLTPHLNSDDRALLALAERSVLRIQGAVDRLSIIAMLGKSATPSVAREPIDLAEVTAEAVSATLGSAPRREVTLEWAPPPAPVPIIGDRWLLVQLLRELVQNGVSHARSAVRVHASVGDGTSSVTIEDDGPGAPALVREAVLAHGKSPPPGTRGVGLLLAMDLADLHGGRISCESSTLPPGRPHTTGARFTFTMPSRNAQW